MGETREEHFRREDQHVQKSQVKKGMPLRGHMMRRNQTQGLLDQDKELLLKFWKLSEAIERFKPWSETM